MKRLRVIVLVHEDLVPPASAEGLSEKELQPVKTELAVANALRELGHEVQVLGVLDDLMPIRRLVEGWEAHVVFNLLMEFPPIRPTSPAIWSCSASRSAAATRSESCSRATRRSARRSFCTTASRPRASTSSRTTSDPGCRGAPRGSR